MWICCVCQQVGQSNTMKEYAQTLVSAACFPLSSINILLGICQPLLLKFILRHTSSFE